MRGTVAGPGRGVASLRRLVRERLRLLRLLGDAGTGAAALLVGLYAVAAALVPVRALAAGRLIGVLARGPGDGELVLAAALVAGAFLLDQVAWLTAGPVRTLVVRRVDGAIRSRVRAVAAGLPGLAPLEDPSFADLATRAVDAGASIDRDRSAGTAVVGQLELAVRVLGGLAAAALLATFAPVLAVVLVVASLAVRAVSRRRWLAVVDRLDADVAGQREHVYVTSEAVYGAAKDVRLFGLSDWLLGRTRLVAVRVFAPVWRHMADVRRGQWPVALFTTAAAALTTAVPAAAVLDGRLDASRLVTLVLAGWGVLGLVVVGYEAYDIEHGLRAVRAADELTARHPPSRAASSPPPEPRGGPAPPEPSAAPSGGPPVIRFEAVTFRYPGSSRPVLDGLTLTLRPGETVALVGANGAGKTTLVKLLAGLYRPDEGRVTVDGADLAGPDPLAWRSRLAVVLQQFVRYPLDLRDNVRLAAPERAADLVPVALQRAGAGEFVERLPEGLDTLLWREGAGGVDLSGGQWQRVALARALFAVAAGRQVLVLDEPTAHLDVRAEAQFHEQVVAGVRGATVLLISHRLSTVRPAQRILLLRDGRVAEDGSHDELMALGGDYARFFRLQAERFSGERR